MNYTVPWKAEIRYLLPSASLTSWQSASPKLTCHSGFALALAAQAFALALAAWKGREGLVHQTGPLAGYVSEHVCP